MPGHKKKAMRIHNRGTAAKNMARWCDWKRSLTTGLVRMFFPFFVLASVRGEASAQNIQKVTSEEYAIYSRLVKHFDVTGQPLVIALQTSVDEGKDLLRIGLLRRLMPEFPLPYLQTIADFKKKNAHALDLNRQIPGLSSYVLVPQSELHSLWEGCTEAKQECGWDLFYRKYPDSPGVMTFSRAGFASTGDDALVYFGYRRDWKAGTGYLVLVHKDQQGWTVVKSVVVWRS